MKHKMDGYINSAFAGSVNNFQNKNIVPKSKENPDIIR